MSFRLFQRREPFAIWQRIATLALLLLQVSLSGCGGCNNSAQTPEERAAEQKRIEAEKKKAQEEREEDPFEIVRPLPIPNVQDNPIAAVKPGHWVTINQPMQANRDDFVGELTAGVVDKRDAPIPLAGTPFRLDSSQSVALPKKKLRNIQTPVFVPHSSRTTRITSRLGGRLGGAAIETSREFFRAMAPHEYVLVVLAREPDAYGYVAQLDSVRPPWSENFNTAQLTHYAVVALPPDRPIALPDFAACWTHIAYVIWDDFDPEAISLEQEQALLDWLHWGGQLIVSGPTSLDGLRGTFLQPYLPVQSWNATTLDDGALQPLNANWEVPLKKEPHPPLKAIEAWTGVDLELADSGSFVDGTGNLVAEQSVGRGRVCVTAFRLAERDLIRWRSFDSFFNACLLRRGARVYTGNNEYAETSLSWVGQQGRPDDPLRTTQLRYFTRDAKRQLLRRQRAPVVRGDTVAIGDEVIVPEPRVAGGAASWGSYSPSSDRAREILRTAAGITIPDSSFVLAIIFFYLLVLVPLNAMFFNVVGRIEWAWVAAPLLAIACSLLVVRLAQLDIGFARSRTEVAVLELQGTYPRGHLTRYTALYTSLSTNYDVIFEDRGAVSQPFPSEDYRLIEGQRRRTVTMRRGTEASLQGVQIDSNTTGMIHSEQYVPLEGGIELVGSGAQTRLRNDSQFDLHSCIILRRTSHDELSTMANGLPVEPEQQPPLLEACWIGDIQAGRSVAVHFANFDEARGAFREAAEGAPVEIDLQGLFALAWDAETFAKGDTRLVARIEQLIPGVQIEPAPSQGEGATLVVANLVYGPRDKPIKDRNSRFDFAFSVEDDELLEGETPDPFSTED